LVSCSSNFPNKKSPEGFTHGTIAEGSSGRCRVCPGINSCAFACPSCHRMLPAGVADVVAACAYATLVHANNVHTIRRINSS